MDSSTQIAPAAANRAHNQRHAVSLLDSERWLGPLLIGPAILYIVLLVGVPFFMALYYIVSDTTTGRGTQGFLGLRNYNGGDGPLKFHPDLNDTITFKRI